MKMSTAMVIIIVTAFLAMAISRANITVNTYDYVWVIGNQADIFAKYKSENSDKGEE